MMLQALLTGRLLKAILLTIIVSITFEIFAVECDFGLLLTFDVLRANRDADSETFALNFLENNG